MESHTCYIQEHSNVWDLRVIYQKAWYYHTDKQTWRSGRCFGIQKKCIGKVWHSPYLHDGEIYVSFDNKFVQTWREVMAAWRVRNLLAWTNQTVLCFVRSYSWTRARACGRTWTSSSCGETAGEQRETACHHPRPQQPTHQGNKRRFNKTTSGVFLSYHYNNNLASMYTPLHGKHYRCPVHHLLSWLPLCFLSWYNVSCSTKSL